MGRTGIRVLILTAVVALSVTVSSQSTAALLPTLEYACEPPVPAAPGNCGAWHTTPVTLHWLFDSSLTPVAGTDCASPHVVDSDTAGAAITCTVTSLATGVLSKTATVRVDQTPPAVGGATPDRPPDHDGWWNHPVGFTFAGSDATSGIAGCDTVVYSGPDGPAGQVAGACRDVAGNAATGSVPLKYDATPPTITPIPTQSAEDEVTLKWSASPDAVQYTVERSPGRDGAKTSTVYTGTSPTYTDHDVAKANNYTYTVSASDAAANASSVVIVAAPGGSQTVIVNGPGGPQPTTPLDTAARRGALPRLKWRRVARADYYNVQVFRGRRKVLSAWPAGTHLQLRSRWSYKGRRFSLTPGSYRWYAWPGFGSRRMHKYGRMVAHRRFTILK
jgi:hypothetical protein